MKKKKMRKKNIHGLLLVKETETQREQRGVLVFDRGREKKEVWDDDSEELKVGYEEN
jgi:hypothetical protein